MHARGWTRKEYEMRYPVLAAVIALALAPAAHAQTKAPSGSPPSATAPSAGDEAKFKAADKNGNGALKAPRPMPTRRT